LDTSFLDNDRFGDAFLDSFTKNANNHNPNPELSTPHKFGIIDKSSVAYISLSMPIEVSIKNNNPDLSREKTRIRFFLVVCYNTYLERLPICVTDVLLCENFSAQAIREVELVSWRSVRINQSSAQTDEWNRRRW
jgi:hypothetical protein